MTPNHLRRVASVVAAAAAAVALSAAPAWAPKYILGSFAFGRCTADRAGTSSFAGDLTAQAFTSHDGQLYLVANVVGSCTDGLDVVATVPGAVAYEFPVVSLTTECNRESAVIEIRPGATTVRAVLGSDTKDGEPIDLLLDLYPSTVIDRIWMPNDPSRDYGRLCAIDRMRDHRADADLATVLNNLALRV